MDLLEFLKGEFRRMDADHRVRAQAWVRYHKQFRGIVDDAKKTTKSRLFIQRTKVACIAGVANVADIIFPSDNFFDVVGRNDPDTLASETIKKLMTWALKAGRFYHEVVQYLLQLVIYGTAFAKVVPYEVTESSIKKEPIMLSVDVPIPIGADFREVKTTVKLARIEALDIFDIWVDPEAQSVDGASGLFHRFRRTLAYLKAQETKKNYKNIGAVEILLEKGKGIDRGAVVDHRRQNVGLPAVEPYSDMVTLYEYWGKVPADIAKAAGIEVKPGEFEVECIVTLAEMSEIIRAERNRMINQSRMFVSDVWEPSGDKSLYGRGIPENVRGSQQALNVTVNLRLDNKAWAIAAPLVVNLDKLENPNEDLVARVNWVIRGRGAAPSEIASFTNIPDVTGNSIAEAQEFERHIDEESAMNKQVQATQSFGSNRTLGGMTMAYSAAARPVRLIAKGVEDNLVGQGLKRCYMMLWQRLDDKITVRVTDDPQAPEYLKDVDRLGLALDVDFLASGSFALTERDETVQNLNTFFDALSKLPQIAQMPNWNWKYMVQKLWEAIGLKDFKKVWLDNPPPQQGAEGSPGGAPNAMNPGAMPPELMAMMGGGGGAEATDGGGVEAGAAEGNGALALLARLGRTAGGAGGGSPAGMA